MPAARKAMRSRSQLLSNMPFKSELTSEYRANYTIYSPGWYISTPASATAGVVDRIMCSFEIDLYGLVRTSLDHLCTARSCELQTVFGGCSLFQFFTGLLKGDVYLPTRCQNTSGIEIQHADRVLIVPLSVISLWHRLCIVYSTKRKQTERKPVHTGGANDTKDIHACRRNRRRHITIIARAVRGQ